jgi:CMP-N-acetylneuraminic acid synthetase
MKKIAALVPVKSFSRRVPNKNMQEINGSSLFERKVKQLLLSNLIDDVYVGSESEEILDIASTLGAIPIRRSAYACNEELASANAMILDFASKITADIGVWAHCTNPFIYAAEYDAALKLYVSKKEPYDSLVSVTKIQSHLWSKYGFPLNFNPQSSRHPFASELDSVFFQNGGIFIQNMDGFLANSYFYGSYPIKFELSELAGFDINTLDELKIAQLLAPWLDEKSKF